MQNIFNDKFDFQAQYREEAQELLGKTVEECNDLERFQVLASLVASKARFQEPKKDAKQSKRIYYFSLEFLIGPLLDNYLLDFEIHDVVEQGLAGMDISLDELLSQEVDPGLGNGGLGRLAACFLDSMATLGIQGYGNGMRYRYGLFKQVIKDGRQVEETDNWLAHGYPWEIRKPASAVVVQFGGQVDRHEGDGKYWFTWEGGEKILAVPYDVPIVGYGGETVNHLRLWSAEPYTEDFDLAAFNSGDYAKANKFRSDVEAISTILYPNDSGQHGKLLRLKQEYLFVSAGLKTILRTYKKEFGNDFEHLGDHVCIHTNDTHPALCGPELMRILVDEENVDFDEAFRICTETISYTNHTVMPEALEKWPIDMVRTLIPRTYMFIEAVDHMYRDNFPKTAPNWMEQLQKTAILWDGVVRMANLSVIFSNSVNGVSDLHTNILKAQTLHEFYELTPEKFNNKTNGVSHRRFLANANPVYARLINEAIGKKWLVDADELERLVEFEDDPSFQEGFAFARQSCKERLAAYVRDTANVELDTNMVFDVQVKRFHAYKRQLLNVFKILDVYNRIITDPTYKPAPTAFIFAGKAAQSYDFAKEVIRLINSVADVVNNDPRANSLIKVAFVPNFAVSNAQYIYPAADISEQISTAGTEASGTSNMKLMFNGAITLGTYDGSNVEITQLAGEDNVKIFGLRANEVDELRASGQYYSWNEYNADRERLGRCVDMLTDGTLAGLSGNFEMIHDTIMMGNDPDLVLKDFHSYVDAWDELTNSYADQKAWRKMAIHNTAKAGFFSSDRTIREYANEIWHI